MPASLDYKKLFAAERKWFSVLSARKQNILAAKLLTFGDSRGEEASLLIGDKKLLCFFPDYTKYGWNVLDNKNQLNTLEGKKINIFLELFLITDNISLTNRFEKKIVCKESVIYTINGKIVEKISNLGGMLSIDCGFPIYVSAPKKAKFEIGKWIQAEGRLDAYLVKGR